MQKLFKLLVFCLALELPNATFAKPPEIALRVVCEDSNAKEEISVSLRTQLEAAGLILTDQLPVKKLFVYAQQDKNSNISTAGWSFSIAHVSNQVTYFVASKIFTATIPPTAEVKNALTSMVQEEGFLSYLNVAHVDKLDADSLKILVSEIVKEFNSRLPNEQPVGK